MTFLLQKQDPLDLTPENGISEPIGTLSENLSISFAAAQTNEQGGGEAKVLQDIWGPIVDRLNEGSGLVPNVDIFTNAPSPFRLAEGLFIHPFKLPQTLFREAFPSKRGPKQAFYNPANHLTSSLILDSVLPGNNERMYRLRVKEIVDFIKENKETYKDLEWVTEEAVLRRGMEQAKEDRKALQELEQRSPGTGNLISRFLGSVGGIATDPINIEAAVIPLPMNTLIGTALREALIGAGVEAMSQVGVKEWYEKLGYEYTPEQFWTAVTTAGAFSGALPFALRAGGKTISLTADQMKKGYKAIVDSGLFKPTPVTRAAEQQADNIEADAASNPFDSPDELNSKIAHEERLEQATVAAENAEPPAMPDTPPAPLRIRLQEPGQKDLVDQALDAVKQAKDEANKAFDAKDEANARIDADVEAGKITEEEAKKLKLESPEFEAYANARKKLREADKAADEAVAADARVYDADNVDGLIYRFDPAEIDVDAQTFQFKAGGDEFGVSERLQGVTKWDPIKAGQITVFEYADGKRFIADGHQRLGLAKRIKSQDPSQDVRLYGHLLREVDGITPEMARVIAAAKNIAEGTGTAIDAAKILRVAPERFGELPPRSALVRQAQGLTLLSDEAFGAVVNNVVPANYAALVGRLIPDDEGLQKNAISVLAKTDPANEFQAEAIVRQVREAGAERVTQDSLFGEEVITESYFTERARIMDRAQKQLRQDKNAFKSLVNNAERLEAEGNQLAKNANQRRAANDEQAIALLQALANRKGPISDALNAAARAARESGSYTEPTRNFVDAIRLAAESGDIDRISSGDVGQLIDAPTQGRTPPLAERAVEDFDEPGGAGVKRQGDQLEQDIFGQIEEAMQPDVALRNDLRRVIDEGADEVTIDAHPAVTKAIDDAMAIPETRSADGYGSAEWLNNREFRFDSDIVIGYEGAVIRLYDDAKVLAWKNNGLEPPVNPVKNDRKAVIILGPPAAGKSSFADPIARKINGAIIDADEAKKVLPEYDNGIGANAVHEESSRIANMIEDLATAEGANIVLPKVGGNAQSIRDLIKRLKDKGYEIDLVDMQVSYANARNRMFRRFIKTGRLVPPDYLRSVGENPSRTYDLLKQEGTANGYSRIDNNVGRNEDVPIIEDTRNLLEGTDLRLRGGRGVSEPGAREPGISRLDEQDFEEISEIDLDLEVPVDLRVDPETGEVVAQTVSLRQIQNDIDQDVRMLDRLRGCVQ